MPSMEVESSSALQTIVNSTVNARTLESIINNPLTFEKASYSTVSSMNARYTPLNRPFTLNHETSNGVSHGEDIPVSSHKATEDMNGVNGNVKKEKDEDAQSVISTEWPRTFLRPPGLKNMANTCYMNSTLQALMHVPPLVRYFLNRTHSDRCSYGVRLCAFCRIERHARDSYPSTLGSRHGYLDPTGIVGRGGVLGHKFKSPIRQEDAHEFFIHLLDKLDEAEKKLKGDRKVKTIIQNIFEGECRQTITCERDQCGHVSHTSQVFMDLSLDILSRDRNIKTSLEDFTRQETLSHDNQYKCEKCNVKSRAKKKTMIHEAPPILTIHLKRFSPSGMRKNNNYVAFPEVLDLNPFISEETRGVRPYRLIATVCHHGLDFSGMSAGHYTANCRSSSGTWNNFDDLAVSQTSLREVLTDRDAYILFYARVDSGSDILTDGSIFAKPSPRPLTPVKLVNGVSHSSPSSGKKRGVDEASYEDLEIESPPKRQRQSSEENVPSPPKSIMKKSLINGDHSKKPLEPLKLRPFANINGTETPKLQAEGSRRVYSEKRIPVGFSDSSTDNRKEVIKPIKYDSQKDIPRLHKPRSLIVTSNNPYKDDPFSDGVMQARQRVGRPFHGGIPPAITPGATRAFTREGLGLKIRRKDMMRT